MRRVVTAIAVSMLLSSCEDSDPTANPGIVACVDAACGTRDLPASDSANAPTVTDDLAGSGVEESFGDAVLKSTNQALYNNICSCETWPVEVQLVDVDDDTTTARIAAQVVHP